MSCQIMTSSGVGFF